MSERAARLAGGGRGVRAHWLVVWLVLTVAAPSAAALEASDAGRARAAFDQAQALRLAYEKDAAVAAIEQFGLALALWAAEGDFASAARAAHGQGVTHEQLGDIRSAVVSHTRALVHARDTRVAQLCTRRKDRPEVCHDTN